MNKTQVKLKYAIGDATFEDAIRKTRKGLLRVCTGSLHRRKGSSWDDFTQHG